MVESNKAAFKFVKFQIPNFTYNHSNLNDTTLKLLFSPQGSFNEGEGIFEIELNLKGVDETNPDNTIIDIKCISVFKFENVLNINEIPDFFYKNAIAIAFPYIRSFISTLTIQANTGTILLGLMNLSNLEQPLRDNTTVI